MELTTVYYRVVWHELNGKQSSTHDTLVARTSLIYHSGIESAAQFQGLNED